MLRKLLSQVGAWICPNCGYLNHAQAKKCWHCGHKRP